MSRAKDIETRVDEVERTQRRQSEEIEQLQRELKALGVDLPDIEPSGRTPLSPEARLAAMRRSAAKARAAKAVREGRGAVGDHETAERLRDEAAEEHDDDDDDEEE